MREADEPDPLAYRHFNAFFVRKLKSSARPIPKNNSAILSPADGCLGAFGKLDQLTLIQAKGLEYSAADLLDDPSWAARFANGNYFSIYLSPSHYHRVHMPLDGKLTATRYVPGRLYSVANFTVRALPRLYCRNERLICLFETPAGLIAQILVGAMLVAGIETVWYGRYGHPGKVFAQKFETGEVMLARGMEMGRFNYGSTVIVLFEPNRIALENTLASAHEVRMGEQIGVIRR